MVVTPSMAPRPQVQPRQQAPRQPAWSNARVSPVSLLLPCLCQLPCLQCLTKFRGVLVSVHRITPIAVRCLDVTVNTTIPCSLWRQTHSSSRRRLQGRQTSPRHRLPAAMRVRLQGSVARLQASRTTEMMSALHRVHIHPRMPMLPAEQVVCSPLLCSLRIPVTTPPPF